MVDAARLLKDLKRLLRSLERDIRERLDGDAALQSALRQEWNAAQQARRTARTEADWLEEEVTQAAVHWILGCVFLRFIEDNHLVERPWLAGPGDRLAGARDRHEAYFRDHPRHSDREYLEACFREAAALPGVGPLFDEAHNPLWRLGISGDAAMALRGLFQRVDPDSGALDHDFTDPQHGTRFLGDLYQDLSEAAKKRYALLQTPDFVESFILDRTLTPAIAEFGYREVRLIDPACGSGHFLLDAFARLFDLRLRHEPSLPLPAAAQAALDAVAGIDINPVAVAIARFRLLTAALKACGTQRLKDAADFDINVATGDSLLHGRRFERLDLDGAAYHSRSEGVRHFTHAEDAAAIAGILGRQYHAVVGNPPYITPKDPGLNRAYRDRFGSCHMKYALSVPFIERFFDLAIANVDGRAGFVGMIVSNAFMKREYGKKLIEQFFPIVDLTHVVDTAGAYIPGHGTPTALLFGRNRMPVDATVRTAMGIKGEPATPADPARGEVWTAILTQIDRAGSESAYVSVADTPRAAFDTHPWSLTGGGAATVREVIEGPARAPLSSRVAVRRSKGQSRNAESGRGTTEIGFASFPGLDEAFVFEPSVLRRYRISADIIKKIIVGESVRDWTAELLFEALAPYDEEFMLVDLSPFAAWGQFLWPLRVLLSGTVSFAEKTKAQLGQPWWGFYRWIADRYRTPLSITFADIATHNHFALDRGGKVFNRTAPVIKLPLGSSVDDHLALVGLLNSSAACFWFKQVCHNKGSTVDQRGARQRTDPFEDFYAFNGTKVGQFPLADSCPMTLARELDRLGQELADALPGAILVCRIPTRAALDDARERALAIRRRMIALQEELDWRCYRLYGLLDEEVEHPDPPPIALGQRAFEIVMARQMAAGELQTTWFERHRSTPIAEIPQDWPADYRAVVERRIALIAESKWIGLVERPEYKRRWQWQPWEEQEREALRAWLCDRLEDARYWGGPPAIRSTHQLADLARDDGDFLAAAALYAGRPDFDLARLVADLAVPEAVPFLPVLRYGESGLRKRRAWEDTWTLQRLEDAIDARASTEPAPGGDGTAERVRVDGRLLDLPRRLTAKEAEGLKAREVGDIPVPPKYARADFLKVDYWRLRGGLDVPKERFISYPGLERDGDGTLPLAWAGYDHLQQATALAGYYIDRKESESWPADRLAPLLVGLLELLPWLKRWHNDYDSTYGARLGDYYEGFVHDEARELGLTVDGLRDRSPPQTAPAGRGRRRKAAG